MSINNDGTGGIALFHRWQNSNNAFVKHTGSLGNHSVRVIRDSGKAAHKGISVLAALCTETKLLEKTLKVTQNSLKLAFLATKTTSTALFALQGHVKSSLSVLSATHIFTAVSGYARSSADAKDCNAFAKDYREGVLKASANIFSTVGQACEFFSFGNSLGYNRLASLNQMFGSRRVFGGVGDVAFETLKNPFMFIATAFTLSNTLYNKVRPHHNGAKLLNKAGKVDAGLGIASDVAKLGLIALGPRLGMHPAFITLAFAQSAIALAKDLVKHYGLFTSVPPAPPAPPAPEENLTAEEQRQAAGDEIARQAQLAAEAKRKVEADAQAKAQQEAAEAERLKQVREAAEAERAKPDAPDVIILGEAAPANAAEVGSVSREQVALDGQIALDHANQMDAEGAAPQVSTTTTTIVADAPVEEKED